MGQVKVALVHDFLFTYGGAERVLSIFHELFPDAPIYTLFASEEVVEKNFKDATIITSSLQKSPLKKWPPLLLASFPRSMESFDFSGFDVVLSSSGAFSHGIITGSDTTHICYCHSPMRYAWDWHHEYLAERGFTNPVSLFFMRQLLSKLRIWDMVSAARVDTFVSNSGVVAARINKFYRRPAQVVYPPIDTDYFDYRSVALDPGTKPYAISASRLTPNKRIDVMIKASALSKFPLVIIGGGAQTEALKNLAQSLQAPVTFAGRVGEEEKRTLIANASCFLFAAEDDFGIGPAEGLSLGVPLITLRKGGIMEILLEGSNGYSYTDPTPENLAAALTHFQEAGVKMSRAEIRASVSQLGMERFKQEIVTLVNHA